MTYYSAYLLVDLDDSDRVRARVGHHRRAEPDDCVAREFLHRGVLFRDFLLEIVVRQEPRTPPRRRPPQKKKKGTVNSGNDK